MKKLFTTDSGVPVSDCKNSIASGECGSVLMLGVRLMKLEYFNLEWIVERVSISKGVLLI
jgi:catalase